MLAVTSHLAARRLHLLRLYLVAMIIIIQFDEVSSMQVTR